MINPVTFHSQSVMHDLNWLKINTYSDTVKFNHNHKYLVLKFDN